jgi:hypothetical protein
MSVEQPPKHMTGAETARLANFLLYLQGTPRFACQYTNHRGETAVRTLKPVSFWYGATEWHPVAQLMLGAIDKSRGDAIRYYPLLGFKLATLRIAK